jgi:S1-C subfamily serine protease
MNKLKSFFSRPFVAGLAGGLVVGVLGLLAIAAGWIEGGTTTTTVAETGGTDAGPARTVPAADGALSAGDIYDRDGGAVAFVTAEQKQTASASPFEPMPQQGGTATGSGFLIDDEGHILTNAHVVDGSSNVTVQMGGDDGETLDAKVLGEDTSTDVAVIQVDPSQVKAEPLQLGDSDGLDVGDGVVAIGNPFGLDNSVTSGIVSALQRQISAPDGFTISNVIQTDAAINPGNSGGPLIDADGTVIGINSQIATGGSSEGNVGVGFAVPINTAKTVAQQLIDNGSAEHAYIGIKGGDLTPEIADTLNLDVDEGAIVQGVTKDSPADDAGLQAGSEQVTIDGQPIKADGDVITAVDGEKITGMDDLVAIVNGKQPGDSIELTVYRDGDTQQITIDLAERPDDATSQPG